MIRQYTAFFASRRGIVVAPLLQYLGNPPNMGVCVACFERDTAGALGLHRAAPVQYIRPEIIAFVLGSLLAASALGEFRPRTGSAPIVRFVLGMFAMVGGLVFLGCPWRALFRLAGGDLNAVVGLVGLAVGVSAGVWFLRNGYNLGRSYKTYRGAGLVLPLLMVGLLALLVFRPRFTPDGPVFFSAQGPGAMHAPILLALAGGLLIGMLAQRTRFCTMGSIRDVVLMGDTHLLSGVGGLFVAALVVNLLLGQVQFGFAGQPVSHSSHLWNFLGMVLSGLAYALGGGCPGRQLILSGEGDGDAAVFVLGMIVGAGLAHNFALAARPDRVVDGVVQVGGVGPAGMVAVGLGLAVCLAVGFGMREKI
jgi:YedE family putative selenium metabolism protein